MIITYLKMSIRHLVRHKVYSAINILGLALGLSASIILVLWVLHTISYNRFHEHAQSIYKVGFSTDDLKFYSDYLPGPLADYLREQYPEVLQSTSLGRMGLKLSTGMKNLSTEGCFVHDDFFEMFTFPFIQGDSGEAFNNPASIILTKETAGRLFGEEESLGEIVTLEDTYDFTVTGIMENTPDNSDIQFDFLLSFALAPPYMRMWDNKAVMTFVRLDAEAAVSEVNKKIRNVYNDHNPKDTRNNLFLQPLSEMHLHAPGGGGRINSVYIYSVMAAIIMIIASINYINLTTARYQSRSKNIGIEKVSGSSRSQLILKFMTESAVTTFSSLIIAVLFVETVLPSVNSLFGTNLTLYYNTFTVIFLIGLCGFTALIAGYYPALFLSGLNPADSLKGNLSFNLRYNRTSNKKKLHLLKNSASRQALVVVQFTLSVFFIACIIIQNRQIDYMQNKNLGFQKNNIMLLNLSGKTAGKSGMIKEALLQNPGIESVSFSTAGMTAWNSSTGIIWEGKLSDDLFDVGCNGVDADYLKTFGLRMIQGRFFSSEFADHTAGAFVINEALLKKMELDEPIGKLIKRAPNTSFEETGRIIGVVADYHTESLHGDIRPFILKYSAIGSIMSIRYKPGDPGRVISAVDHTIKEYDADAVLDYRFLDEELDSLYKSDRLMNRISIYITMIAIFVSCLGLVGLASFTSEKRSKEIGIRKVLGATTANIVILLSGEFLKLVIIADLLALPIAFMVMKKWISNYAYRIDLDPSSFAAAGVIAILIAWSAVAFQSIRAAIANPVNSIKYE